MEVDVFVGNNTFIDFDVYRLWLNGHSAHEAGCIRQQSGVCQQYQISFDILLGDILDQYRTYSMLEKYFKHPVNFFEQTCFQIDEKTQREVIERYYEFDPEVIREILGKKLTSRQRKELDDVSEKTHVPLKSCRRQFDNIKRIFKVVEEMLGSLVENIQKHYLLSDSLSKKYAAVVFITNNRFETGKKRMAYLTFDDFAYCANEMMANWSFSSKECDHHEDMDQDLDGEFLQGLRDIKILTDKYLDEHKSLTLGDLTGKLSDKVHSDAESNFKNMSKVIVGIGSNLNHGKDVREIFDDLVEKFIEPCKQSGWSYTELQHFLNAYQASCHDIETFRRNSPHVLKIWKRYMNTLRNCILQLYHI